jgi:hypothetical protein
MNNKITFRQWLKHLWVWLLDFPAPWKDADDLHAYIGFVDGDPAKAWCVICDRYREADEINEVSDE